MTERSENAGLPKEETGNVGSPLGGTRAQALQRLQIGMSGIAAMVLIVGLANIIRERANVTEAAAVPEAVSTHATQSSGPPISDPLADAGVVPDLPAQHSPSPTGPQSSPTETNTAVDGPTVPPLD